MKTVSIYPTLFFVCLAALGCSKNTNTGEPGVMKSPNYVQTYIVADALAVKEADGTNGDIIAVNFTGIRVSSLPPDADAERFGELADSYNDVSYTGYVIPNANKALAHPLSSMSVICDKEFDTDHGAGQPLDDIILLCATSPYDYIQSGYKDVTSADRYPNYWYPMAMNREEGYKPVELPLNTVGPENTKMLFPLCYLYFTKRPASGGDYNFTVTVKMEENEMTGHFTMSF